MALIGNYSVYNKSPARFSAGGDVTTGGSAQSKSNLKSPSVMRSRDMSIPALAALPNGYAAGSAFTIPRSDGGLADYSLSAAITNVTSLNAGFNLSATLTSVVTLTNAAPNFYAPIGSAITASVTLNNAPLAAFAALFATLNSNISTSYAQLDSDIFIFANLSASITPINAGIFSTAALSATLASFTALSPQALAQAVWDEKTDAHTTSNTYGTLAKKALTTSKFIGLK
jgi:hypothetical protein